MFVEPPQPLVGAMASLSGSRRTRGLTDIIPHYSVPKTSGGLFVEGEVRSVTGSVRIHHLTGVSPEGRSRFPKLEECAHFHYEHVELGPIQVSLCEDESLRSVGDTEVDGKAVTVKVTSCGQTWLLRRTYGNFNMLDQQLHRCVYDRKFSNLPELPETAPDCQETVEKLLSGYLTRLSSIAGSLMNCGPVLSWLELDNRGRRLLVTEGDSCPINTPAVAAAYSIKKYTAVAADEISFDIGDMISVIDMPPPEESAWWRGKRGFLVGFFPSHCVAVITEKLPRNLNLNQSLTLTGPTKPVLRKHGKLIAFFRAFILSRPSRRRLKQSGILKERVFGCDLGEHLLNSGQDIPMVLKCCSEFIESHGIVDGIYRLSGVTSNIQKLRRTFDEDRVPALYEDEAILQDIHSVASLLKMYFRELPNPLCTYQLYSAFVQAVQTDRAAEERLIRMREAVEKLPPPHYRTLEYLMRHLARVSERGAQTGMTARNVAIVWAPNLLRCKELEVGGVAALQGVGVQAVVTEFLIVYADLIFCSTPLPTSSLSPAPVTPRRVRPKSLAISTPTKLLSLEEAQSRALAAGKPDQDYIEVGGGPSCLPAKYHTVIELPRKRAGSKRSPLGWKSFFSKSSRGSSGHKSRTPTPDQRKVSAPTNIVFPHKALTESDLTSGRRRLRPVKSVESLASGQNSARSSSCLEPPSPPTPQHTAPPGHNRSVSHDSYFDMLAETPLHCNNATLLQEEDEEDLSELQVNFDLEESEMRIFSEDESNQLYSSHTSLDRQVVRRQPLLARAEDSSADPSPKKHKTGSRLSNNRSKRSRLEERLSNAELRYIDSGSPDQVQTQAEIHGSPPEDSNSPSLADATVSENETLSFSGLTTPDTNTNHPHYTPLTEDSLSDAVTTPEYHKLTPSPLTATYENIPRDRLSYQGDRGQKHYDDVSRDRLSFQGILNDVGSDLGSQNLETFGRISCNISSEAMDTTTVSDSKLKAEEINYEEIKESSIYESLDDNRKDEVLYENVINSRVEDSEVYETVMRKQLGTSYEEISAQECLISERLQCGGISSSRSLISAVESRKENEYECLGVDTSPDESNHISQPTKADDNVYEDVQTVPLADSMVYQQMKYLQRSVHEINQLLEESMEPFTAEEVSSLEEEETISPMKNGVELHNGSSHEKHGAEKDFSRRFEEARLDSSESVPSPTIQSENVTPVSVSPLQETNKSVNSSDKDLLYENSTMDDIEAISTSYEESVPSAEMVFNNSDSKIESSFDDQVQNVEMIYDNSHSKSAQEMLVDGQSIGVGLDSNAKSFQDFTDDSEMNVEMKMEFADSKSKDSLNYDNEPSFQINYDANSKSVQHSLEGHEQMEFPITENSFLSDKETDKHVDSTLSDIDSIDVSKTPPKNLSHSFNSTKNEFETEEVQMSVKRQETKPEPEVNSFNIAGLSTSSSGRNVQELMSRFEKESLPPCLKAKLSRQNSKDKTPTLTTSLDASSFPSDNNVPLTRVKTSPDLNQNKEENTKGHKTVDSSADPDAIRRERIEKYKEERRTFLRKKYRTDSFNNNDDKDEEMIRRLKAKANMRTSESGDDNGQNAPARRDSLESIDWTPRRSPSHKVEVSESGINEFARQKELESRLCEEMSENKSMKNISPSKTLVSISYSPTKTKALGWESAARGSKSPEFERLPDRIVFNRSVSLNSNTDSLRDTRVVSTSSGKPVHRPEDLNLTGISNFKKTEDSSSPKIVGKIDKRVWKTSEDQIEEGVVAKSPDGSLVQRRLIQLSSSSGDVIKSETDASFKRKASLTDHVKPPSMIRQRANSGSAKSPSYCIRDMAALFENRDVK